MALTPNSALWQIENANELLAQYFSDLAKYANDETGSISPPNLGAVTGALDYSELHRVSMVRSGDSASFENGAAIENIHMMVSIIRESNLRAKGKVDYYSDAGSDYTNESNFYSTMKPFWVNMLNGVYEEGKTT